MNEQQLSIVVPVYNEEGQVCEFVRTVREVLETVDLDFEIVFIDDGSTDATWNELNAQHVNDHRIQALRLSRNFGKEAALMAGMEVAKGDAVVVMDVDFQHPPSMLPRMIQLWQAGHYKIVEARKVNRGSERLISRASAKTFYFLMNRGTNLNLTGSTDFKLLDREVVNILLLLPERITFFRGLCGWVGFKRTQVEFDVPARVTGKSRWKFTELFRLAVGAITSFSSLPLHFVNVVGVVFLLFAVLLGIQTLYRYLSGTALSGFTTVILLQLIIGALCMLSLGIIGVYVSRLYDEAKARPRFIVSERATAKRQFLHRDVQEITLEKELTAREGGYR